jgi:hypothetical protein
MHQNYEQLYPNYTLILEDTPNSRVLLEKASLLEYDRGVVGGGNRSSTVARILFSIRGTVQCYNLVP